METNSQLHHDLILPSDEGVEESLVDMEGLLSSRHKQLLLKVIFLTDILTLHISILHSLPQCLAKKESTKFTADSRHAETEPLQQAGAAGGGGGGGGGLKRLQSERFSQAAGGELMFSKIINIPLKLG